MGSRLRLPAGSLRAVFLSPEPEHLNRRVVLTRWRCVRAPKSASKAGPAPPSLSREPDDAYLEVQDYQPLQPESLKRPLEENEQVGARHRMGDCGDVTGHWLTGGMGWGGVDTSGSL
jgi:hypothetical protein